MLGKTHATIGVVAGLAIMQPHDLTSLVIGGTLAAIGALAPDIDEKNSMASKNLNKIIKLITSVTILIVIGIFGYRLLQQQVDIQVQLPSLIDFKPVNFAGGTLLILFGIFGTFQKHRTFTHSVFAMALASLFAWMFVGNYGIYFGIGYASHLALDLLNFQGIQLLYPLEKRFSLKLCKSNGTVNTALFVLGIVAIVELSAYLLTGQLIA